MRTVSRILLCVLICGLTGLSVGPVLVAVAKPGSITGTLRNGEGQTFPGVRVEVSGPFLPKEAPSPDDSTIDGFYEITELPPGVYSLKFSFMRRYDETALSGRGRIDCATREKVLVRAARKVTVNAILKYCGDFTYETRRSH